MTRKRYVAVGGMLAILVGAGFAVAMMIPADTRPGISKTNYDRIEIGMTLNEVWIRRHVRRKMQRPAAERTGNLPGRCKNSMPRKTTMRPGQAHLRRPQRGR